jgi:hypothetical protein
MPKAKAMAMGLLPKNEIGDFDFRRWRSIVWMICAMAGASGGDEDLR